MKKKTEKTTLSGDFRVKSISSIYKLKYSLFVFAFMTYNDGSGEYYVGIPLKYGGDYKIKSTNIADELFKKSPETILSQCLMFKFRKDETVSYRRKEIYRNKKDKSITTYAAVGCKTLDESKCRYIGESLHNDWRTIPDFSYYLCKDYINIRNPDFFSLKYKTYFMEKNCYVKYSSGNTGFKLTHNKVDYFFSFQPPCISGGLFDVNLSAGMSCFVPDCSFSEKVDMYGDIDEYFAKAIISKMKKLQKLLPGYISLKKFLEFLNKRKNENVVLLYKDLIRKARTYEECGKYINILSEHFTGKKAEAESRVSADLQKQETSPPDNAQGFDYTKFKETNGIFYSLSDESAVFGNTAVPGNIKCQYVKKIAYVPSSEKLSGIFSLLVIDIDLERCKVVFKSYSPQCKTVTLPILVDEFLFSFINVSDGTEKIFAAIASEVCNKIYNNCAHKDSVTYNSYEYFSHSQFKAPIIKNKDTILCFKLARASDHPANAGYTGVRSGSSIKKMHVRRGHWHYYWYGKRNSSERVRRLKWVEEAVVNRDSENIILLLE